MQRKMAKKKRKTTARRAPARRKSRAQERITGFVAAHSGISEKRYTELMLRTGELVMDVGTVLDGRKAVREKLIDELGGLSDALAWLYKEIEKE